MRYRQRFSRGSGSANSRNKILAKRTALQLLALTGNLLVLLLKITAGVFILLKTAAVFIIRLGIKFGGLPLYSAVKKIASKLQIFHAYWQKQFGENFSRNIVLYGGLAFLAVFATAQNIKARELRPEDIGRNSSLFVLLASQSDYELVEEEALATDETVPASARAQDDGGLAAVGVQDRGESFGTAGETALPRLLSESGDALIMPDLTGTEITPVLRDSIIAYTVEEGDTISEIADKFNISTNTILWENNLGARDFIKPGQNIQILPVTGISYTIKRGDTLPAIAARYRAKDEDIVEVNKLTDASDLKVGAKIIIPDGIPPAAPSQAIAKTPSRASIGDIFKPAAPAAGRFNWPTISRRISQYFRGWRHTGLDIPAPTGQPVYAAEGGVVITSGWSNGGYGYYIIIDHGNGVQTLYGHNSRLSVERGDRVVKGQVIGSVGSTGRSTGPHIHFEVRIDGNRVNPLGYL